RRAGRVDRALLQAVLPQPVEARAARAQLPPRRQEPRPALVVSLPDPVGQLRARAGRAARVPAGRAMNAPARFTYEYARPALAVDCVVFGLDAADLKVLLIQRKLEPKHEWALPGGFVHIDETLDDAARREL